MAVHFRLKKQYRSEPFWQIIGGSAIRNPVRSMRRYRGLTRKYPGASQNNNISRPLFVGFFAMAATLLAIISVFSFVPNMDSININILLSMLGLGTIALAWVFALSCAVRRTVFQDAKAAFLGVGVVLIGGLVPTSQTLITPFLRQRYITPVSIQALGISGHVVGYLALLAVATLPDLISKIKGWTVIAGSAIFVVVIWVPLGLLPSVVQHVSVLSQSPAALTPRMTPALIIGISWLTLGASQLIKGIINRRSLDIWIGNTMVAWAFSYLFIPLWKISPVWAAATGAFELAAMLFAIVGIDFELEWSFRTVAQNLMDSLVTTRLLSADREIEIGFSQKRIHDMHNILFSVEGATNLLQRQGSLTSSQRSVVSSMLASQLAYLQRLIESPLLEVASTLESVWMGAQAGIDMMRFQLPGCAPQGLCAKKLAGSTEDNCRAIRLVLDHLAQNPTGVPPSVAFKDEGSHISIALTSDLRQSTEDEMSIVPEDGQLELYAADLLLRRNGGAVTHRVYQGREEVKLWLLALTDRNSTSSQGTGTGLSSKDTTSEPDTATPPGGATVLNPLETRDLPDRDPVNSYLAARISDSKHT